MRRSTKSVVGTVAALALTAGAGTVALAASSRNRDPQSEQRNEAEYTDAHRAEATVLQVEAERLAQGARPGTVVESHLQTEGNTLRWEVKTDDGAHLWEVQLDPYTGSVVANQSEE